MKRLSLLMFVAVICLNFAVAQSSKDVLLTLGERKVTTAEFERVYNKNYNINATEKQTVEEYFDLFLKFKLKVFAALDAKIDTLPAFKHEFKGYRDQLAKTYLTDNQAADSLINEAYQHMVNELNVSHIMVLFKENGTSADTAAAVQKIMKIYDRLKAGEQFEKLAQELSEDPSAKSNKGNIGYFSAFRYPYLFESAAYQTKVGQYSKPVRTSYGYHIIRVNEKRPSAGEVKVAHIMVAVPQDGKDSVWNKAKLRIDSLYTKLKGGEDFTKLAGKYSDDQNSGRQGGELPWFGAGRMVPEFETVAFSLKEKGDISQPTKTAFGWHIVKLIDKRGVAPFDQAKGDIKTKIMNDERAEIINSSFLKKIKKEYAYKANAKNLAPFYALDSSIYNGNINLKEDILAKPLFTIAKKEYTGADFKGYLITNPITKGTSVHYYIDKSFDKFVNKSYLQYEDDNLEKKYADFGNLISEYYDGILLFDIMDTQVWTKATQDTVGLEAYYKNEWSKGKTDVKPFAEVKGLVTADYQNFLEEKWLEGLKNKYKVVINQEVFHKLADKYKNK